MENETSENASGRIPRELLHNQQERLSNKHIKTLTFLQQVAKENKALKERIKLLEESQEKCKSPCGLTYDSQEEQKSMRETYLAHADEIRKLASEHTLEIMKLQEEKSEMERGLKEQILKMHYEIESLKAANNDLRETAAEENESNSKQQMMEILNHNKLLEKHNEDLKNDIESLREDLHILQSKKATEMTKLHDLKEENKQLKHSLQETQQKANELELRLDKAFKELKEQSKTEEYRIIIENLHEKVQTLQQEYQNRLEFETGMKQDFRELQSLKDEVLKTNIKLQNELENLLSEYGLLVMEYNKLKKHSKLIQDKTSFKDFVQLKRELNVLRDENEFLKLKSKPDFVMMKKDVQPHPPSIMKKKNSFDGARNGTKKFLAITSDNIDSRLLRLE